MFPEGLGASDRPWREIYACVHALLGYTELMAKSTSSSARWVNYVSSVVGTDTQATIGMKTGVSAATISRWSVFAPKPENVAAFARAYQRPVLEAFIAASFLSEEEAGQQPTVRPSAASLSNEELLQELRGRLDHQSDYELAAHIGDPDIGPEDLPNET